MTDPELALILATCATDLCNAYRRAVVALQQAQEQAEIAQDETRARMFQIYANVYRIFFRSADRQAREAHEARPR